MTDENVLNMSLDDIIRQKSTKSSTRPAGRKKSTGRGSGKDDRGSGKLKVSVNVGGAISKPSRRSGPRGRNSQYDDAGPRLRGESRQVADQPRDLQALDGPNKWSHDLFEEGQPQARRVRPAVGGFKILISNLDYKVTDEDIQELFENCGPIQKAGIIYDRSGRSKEEAEVVFQNRSDALAAVKQYNNLALDNKPMKIQLIEEGGSSGGRMLSSGLRLGAQGGRMQSSRRVEGPARQTFRQSRQISDRRGSAGKPRGRGAAVSMNDLDKDLDSYMTTD